MLPVLAETAYPGSAPGARVRLLDFVPFLDGCGVELTVHPTLTDSEYSTVISSGSPAGKARVLGSAAMRLVRRPGINPELLFLVHRLRFLLPLPAIDPPTRLDIYDFDDALFVGSTMNENRRFAWVKREAERWRQYTKRARITLAGNSYLADQARQQGGRVEILPSCVNPAVQPVREHEEVETVRIGWVGSQSTAVYLEQLLPVFERLWKRGRNFELAVVGAGHLPAAPWIRPSPWSLDSERELLASFDIGIMPLPDDPWTRGKCGYKILQYFAAGVPAVVSPVGVNRKIVGTERGLLATSEVEWLEALDQLVLDADMRREAGANARSFVVDEYSFQTWAPRLAELLGEL